VLAQRASTACAHILKLLRRETPDFIITPNLWLLNISDFSPVDTIQYNTMSISRAP